MELRKSGINFQEQVPVILSYSGKSIGKYFLDFVIEDKIVLEIKVAPRFYTRDIKQVLAYLKASGLLLGILVAVNKGEIKFKRILKGNN